MLSQIDHVNIVVQDMEKMVAFYRDVLGFEEKKRVTVEGKWIEKIVGLKNVKGEVAYMVPKKGPRIELLIYRSPEGEVIPQNKMANTVGIRHIAFECDDLEKEVSRLKLQNVAFVNDVVRIPESAVKHSKGKKSVCYFYDPEDNLLELAEYKM